MGFFKRKQEQDVRPVSPPYTEPIHVPVRPVPDWEVRRYEIARMLALQDRRSVVLGKLRANNETIARNARKLADALIKELKSNPLKLDNDEEKAKH